MAEPDPFAPRLTSARYAHTLLFVCPGCNLPISISRISGERSSEVIASQSFRLKCGYCRESATFRGLTAKLHWVTEWA
jgi:hypothetical protein